MIELNSAQCDALQSAYPGLRVWKTMRDFNPWVALRSSNEKDQIYGQSRGEALKRWQRLYAPDWTPPDVWDAETALEYAKKKKLTIQFTPNAQCVVGSKYQNQILNEEDNAIGAIECWKSTYDSDEAESIVERQCTIRLLRGLVNSQAARDYFQQPYRTTAETELAKVQALVNGLEATDGS